MALMQQPIEKTLDELIEENSRVGFLSAHKELRLKSYSAYYPPAGLEVLLEIEKYAGDKAQFMERKTGGPAYRHPEAASSMYHGICMALGIAPFWTTSATIALHDRLEDDFDVTRYVDDIRKIDARMEKLRREGKQLSGEYAKLSGSRNESQQKLDERRGLLRTETRDFLYTAISTSGNSFRRCAEQFSDEIMAGLDILTRKPENQRYFQSAYSLVAPSEDVPLHRRISAVIGRYCDHDHNAIDIGKERAEGFAPDFNRYFGGYLNFESLFEAGGDERKGSMDNSNLLALGYETFLLLNSANRLLRGIIEGDVQMPRYDSSIRRRLVPLVGTSNLGRNGSNIPLSQGGLKDLAAAEGIYLCNTICDDLIANKKISDSKINEAGEMVKDFWKNDPRFFFEITFSPTQRRYGYNTIIDLTLADSDPQKDRFYNDLPATTLFNYATFLREALTILRSNSHPMSNNLPHVYDITDEVRGRVEFN